MVSRMTYLCSPLTLSIHDRIGHGHLQEVVCYFYFLFNHVCSLFLVNTAACNSSVMACEKTYPLYLRLKPLRKYTKSSLKTQWNHQAPSVKNQKHKYNNLQTLGKLPKNQMKIIKNNNKSIK